MTEIPKKYHKLKGRDELMPDYLLESYDEVEATYTLEDKQMGQEKEKTMPTMFGKEALIWIARGEYFSFRAKVYRLAETGEIIEQRGDDWYTAKEDVNDIVRYGVYAVYFDPSKPVESDEDEYEKDKKFVMNNIQFEYLSDERKQLIEFMEKHYVRKDPK